MSTFITVIAQAAVSGNKQKKRYTITSADPVLENSGIGFTIDGVLVQFLAPFGGATHVEMYTGLTDAIAQEILNSPTGIWSQYGLGISDNGTSIDLESKYGGANAVDDVVLVTVGVATASAVQIQASSTGTPQINNVTPQGTVVGSVFSITSGGEKVSQSATSNDNGDIVTSMTALVNANRDAKPNGGFGFPAPYNSIGGNLKGIIAVNKGTFIQLIGISGETTPETSSGGVSFTQTSEVITPVSGDDEDLVVTLSNAEEELADQLQSVCRQEVYGLSSEVNRQDMFTKFMAWKALSEGDLQNDEDVDCLVSELKNL